MPFVFIKAVYLRKLKQIVKENDFNGQVKAAIMDKGANRLQASDVFRLVSQTDPDNAALLEAQIGRFQFNLILNQFRPSADSKLGDKITTVCNRHFYSPFEFLGRVDFDERVIDSIYTRKTYIANYPGTSTARQLKQIADGLAVQSREPSSDILDHEDI
jgi:MinD-like ATPase involved in chromosome partitioning or flagellar assembly